MIQEERATKYVGLIGYPLGHSISPPMQQAAFDHYRLDVHYEFWQTEPAELVNLSERLRHDDTLGANVTVPHKETIIPLMDEMDDLAYEVGAVNTIVNRGGQLIGYNTDAGGFLRSLRKEGGFDPAGKGVIIVGAGGVAHAVCFALARAGAKSLFITDIITRRAQELATALERSLSRTQGPAPRSCYDAKDVGGVQSLDFNVYPKPRIKVSSPTGLAFRKALSECDLLVNCSPVGMRHTITEGKSPVEAKLIPRGALVYDVVYNPLETKLLTDAKKAGARTLGGLAMLVYQGAMAFELWAGKEAPIDVMFEAAKKAL
jgi:shikimate dehydrogenase